MNSHAEFAAQLSARAAGKSLVGAGGVQLYEMSSGRDVMNETQDEAVYHDPSEVSYFTYPCNYTLHNRELSVITLYTYSYIHYCT